MHQKLLMKVLLSGILLALATPPLGIWPLVFFAFVPFILGAEEYSSQRVASCKRLFLFGIVFGSLHATSLFFWLVHINPWILFPVVLGFSSMHGFFAVGIFYSMKRGLQGFSLAVWVIALWVSIEIIYSGLFFSLPSYAVGYLLWKVPLFIQSADIAGVFGVSVWILGINLLLVRLYREGFRENRAMVVSVLVLTGFIVGYGHFQLTQGQKTGTELEITKVAVVHSAIRKEEKEDPEKKKELFAQFKKQTLATVSKSISPPELYIWPETSVPLLLRSITDKDIVAGLLDTAKKTNASVLLGALSFSRTDDGEVNLYNTAFLVPPKGYISQEYHKVYLAPFVESKPYIWMFPKKVQEKWQRRKMSKGNSPGVFTLGGKKIGIFICWEAFFPDFVRQVVLKGADCLINITNDEAAFGNIDPAYPIPLPHAVFRAVENRRFLARCANWGNSMIISPQGRILTESGIGKSGVLSYNLPTNKRQTYFTRHGFLFAKILLTVTFLRGVYLAWRKQL